MEIEMVEVSKLKHAEYNPRKISEKDFSEIRKSLAEFGFVEPLVVNKSTNRYGVIVGGNQRYEVALGMGMATVPVFWVDIPNLKREKELNIRLNRNQGAWDFDILNTSFDLEDLTQWGFEDWELDLKDKETDENIIKAQEQVYRNNTVRQITLYYDEADYEKILKVLNILIEKEALENYSELIKKMVMERAHISADQES